MFCHVIDFYSSSNRAIDINQIWLKILFVRYPGENSRFNRAMATGKKKDVTQKGTPQCLEVI